MKKFLRLLGKRIKRILNLNQGLGDKHIFAIAIAVCFILIGLSFFTETEFMPLRFVANYTVVPMKKGINRVGTWLGKGTGSLETFDELKAENAELKAQIENLKDENARLMQDMSELERLRDLYGLEEAYGNYHKIGARIISRDSSNWFNKFTIDKGSNDGLAVDMNVIAAGGLVGIITEVGPDYATVRSIIDDKSTVSAMSLSTNDICYVEGDLTQINEGTIRFVDMENNSNEIYKGETIVTSNISSKFLPGIVIGYISSIRVDANNLTRSGVLVPTVDFSHLQEVLVITDLKSDIASLELNPVEDTTGTAPEEDENAEYFDMNSGE